MKTMNHREADKDPPIAPEISAHVWLNTQSPLSLLALRGKVVVLHAFQMLCPGCVTHGLPQAGAIVELFPESDVQVIGLHSVFEHHSVMTVDALKAFVHEYKIQFPIAVDLASDNNPIPQTMQAYTLQGTPSLVLIDKLGRMRLKFFGRMSDMEVGSLIAGLLQRDNHHKLEAKQAYLNEGVVQLGCDSDGCAI